jgi:TonB family protein
MAAEFLKLLGEAALVSSLAIVVIALLRLPLRRWLGARSAYWIWLLAPMAVAAALLPGPARQPADPVTGFAVVLSGVANQASALFDATATSPNWTWLWSAGFVIALTILVGMQSSFQRRLGRLQSGDDGAQRSDRIAGPALVGAWRPRLVLPSDFESRYDAAQQRLVLAHEQAHLRRGDTVVNALAALALCVFWFNPLAYWAVGRLRFDQELACDAEVMGEQPESRRDYADAMLKTQLAADAAWRLPIGCQWQACHPLKERISMLKHPVPNTSRRLGGTGLVVALGLLASMAAWAAVPAEDATKPQHLHSIRDGETLTKPIYPPQALADKVEGMVVLDIYLGPDGTVSDFRVVSSRPAGVFDQASIDAARLWRFIPGRIDNGKPLAGWIRIPVEFKP